MSWTSSVFFMCPSTLSEVNWMMAPAPSSSSFITPSLTSPPPPPPPHPPTHPRPSGLRTVVSAPLGLDGSGVRVRRGGGSSFRSVGSASAKSSHVGKMSPCSQKIQPFTVQDVFTGSGGYLTFDLGPPWLASRLRSREVFLSGRSHLTVIISQLNEWAWRSTCPVLAPPPCVAAATEHLSLVVSNTKRRVLRVKSIPGQKSPVEHFYYFVVVVFAA